MGAIAPGARQSLAQREWRELWHGMDLAVLRFRRWGSAQALEPRLEPTCHAGLDRPRVGACDHFMAGRHAPPCTPGHGPKTGSLGQRLPCLTFIKHMTAVGWVLGPVLAA